MPRSASIKRWLFDPALAAGLALLLASAAPASADFFGMPEQPRIEDADAGPPPAAKTYRSTSHRKTSHRQAKRHDSDAKQALAQGPFQIVVAIARQQVTLYGQNGAIARAAISTGVPEHPTPLGVFTVISKH